MYRSLAAEQPKNDKEPCTFYSAIVINNTQRRIHDSSAASPPVTWVDPTSCEIPHVEELSDDDVSDTILSSLYLVELFSFYIFTSEER